MYIYMQTAMGGQIQSTPSFQKTTFSSIILYQPYLYSAADNADLESLSEWEACSEVSIKYSKKQHNQKKASS